VGVEVANESGLPVDELRLVGVSRHVLDALRIHPLAELSILLVDEAEMTVLHERWMDEPGPTDVLSFPMDELRPGRFDLEIGPDDDAGMLGEVDEGFRYAQVENWPGDFDPADVTAVVVHTDLDRTGTFTSSHSELNRLHENVVWGMRGNFLSIPTDCPQRDERLGALDSRMEELEAEIRRRLADLGADAEAARNRAGVQRPGANRSNGCAGEHRRTSSHVRGRGRSSDYSDGGGATPLRGCAAAGQPR